MLIFIIVRGAAAFSRDFTTNLDPQCRAFSGALKVGKLKVPLFPGPEGTVDSNDWCIIVKMGFTGVTPCIPYFHTFALKYRSGVLVRTVNKARVPMIYVWSKYKENITFLHLKITILTDVKNRSIIAVFFKDIFV